MDTYQEWRATIGALMSKLYFPTGYDYHRGYKIYAEGRRENDADERARDHLALSVMDEFNL